MKKIKLHVIGTPDKSSVRQKLHSYNIFLDWGITAGFKSKRKADAFQNRLNDWINNQVFILNDHYIQCFQSYRNIWLYMDREKQTEAKINKHLNNVGLWLDQLMNSDYKGLDQAFFLLERIAGCIEALKLVYELLNESEKRRNSWDTIKKHIYRSSLLDIMQNEIKNYSDPTIQGGSVL
jgi:hypothetical protein